MNKISLSEKLESFDTHWEPKILAQLNDHQVKIAKLKGEFIWHQHEDEDELFYVIKGQLKLEFRDRVEELGPGDLIVVPKMVEHRPIAENEVHVMLIEPATTRNTGSIEDEKTVQSPEWI